jgi:hypothetical protein
MRLLQTLLHLLDNWYPRLGSPELVPARGGGIMASVHESIDTLETRKRAFVDFLMGYAQWRSRGAADYPGDTRHERSAAALTALAEAVRAMPLRESPLLSLLRGKFIFAYGAGDNVFIPGKRLARAVSRWGFGDEATRHMTHMQFIEHLCDLAAEDQWEAEPLPRVDALKLQFAE